MVSEKNFTPEEIIAMHELLQKVSQNLSTKQNLTSLQQMVTHYQQSDKAFGIAVAFGGAVKENPAITTPTFKQDALGTRIEVPSNLYALWKTYADSLAVSHMLDDYTARPHDKTNAVYGRSPYQIARSLETLTAYASSLEEKP